MTTATISRSPETIAATDLLRDLAKGFTSRHEQLQVQGADPSPTKAILAIRCHPHDYPKLVGAKGKHHRSLQTILAAVGSRVGREIEFTLLPADRAERAPDAFNANPRWDHGPMRRLLDRTLAMAWGANGFAVELNNQPELATFVVHTSNAALVERLDYQLAVHAIFHAIGKNEGKVVHVEFRGPTPAE